MQCKADKENYSFSSRLFVLQTAFAVVHSFDHKPWNQPFPLAKSESAKVACIMHGGGNDGDSKRKPVTTEWPRFANRGGMRREREAKRAEFIHSKRRKVTHTHTFSFSHPQSPSWVSRGVICLPQRRLETSNKHYSWSCHEIRNRKETEKYNSQIRKCTTILTRRIAQVEINTRLILEQNLDFHLMGWKIGGYDFL